MFIVSTGFLDECQQIEDQNFNFLPLLKKHSLTEWGSLVKNQIFSFFKIQRNFLSNFLSLLFFCDYLLNIYF